MNRGGFDLRVHRKLSLISGLCYPMPEDYESRSEIFRFFWKFYVYLPHAMMLVELMSQTVQIVKSIENVEGLTTCILSMVYVVQFLLKMAIFKRNEKVFEEVLGEMVAISETLSGNPTGDGKFLLFYERHYSRVKTVGIWKGGFQLASNLFLNVLFCVLSWTGKQRRITPAFSWTPYDSSKNPEYTITCLFELICYGAVTARSGVLDLLFWVMIAVPTIQLNYLRYLMEIIFHDGGEDEEENKKFQDGAEEKGKLKFQDGGEKDGKQKFQDGGDDAIGFRTGKELSKDVVRSRFDWWLKQHQRILENVLRFESLASAFLGVNYLASLINLFMSGFVAISSSHWDIFQRVLINAIIITDAFQLYVVSLAGDLLRESSEGVTDLGLTDVLFRGNKSMRKDFFFALMRTRRYSQFRFGGVNPLSSQTFSKLIQLTMSYFVTVLQIRKIDLKSNPT